MYAAMDGIYEYCLPTAGGQECYSFAPAAYFASYRRDHQQVCAARDMEAHKLQPYIATKTLHEVWHVLWTITPILFSFAAARLAAQSWSRTAYSVSTLRFLLEFVIIIVPTVVSVNVANEYVFYFVVAMTVGLLLLMWRTKCISRAREREFEFGKRPCMLTLARATINLLTALCILAIDFKSFPKEFRKSRTYGAGLMDVGIGLFTYAMGTVSRRPRRGADLTRLMRTVAPLLFLGLARTVVIIAIDYHQDEHEYGVHLNAFFTLGLTKLFGTLLSAVATSELQLLYLGAGVLLVHEFTLQLGIGAFVMNASIERNNLLAANREGICSLPGFIGLYLFSMYIGQWLQGKDTLTFNEFKRKLQSMAIVSSMLWKLTVGSIYLVGLARVTCNFGYVVWILAIAVTMTLLFMIVFDLVLNTLWPVQVSPTNVETISLMEGEMPMKASATTEKQCLRIPTIVEAINFNGLTFFLVSNILTGGANIFLKPEYRTDSESVAILTMYMLIATAFVFILYRCNLRVA